MSPKTALRLSVAFGLVYFFSTNGLAALPGNTLMFFLKDNLKFTASGQAYFGAIATIGWLIKPLWGIISDTVPVLGYRRKSWLVITALLDSAVWFFLGNVVAYTAAILLISYIISSVAYSFNDVACDGLMVQTGKPENLTGRFQSVQWAAVYIAAIITGVGGGLASEHLAPQTVFNITGIFPLIVALAAICLIKEEKIPRAPQERTAAFQAIGSAMKDKSFWAAAFFLFFWTFSPSFGAPMQYYQIDILKFDKIFFGILGSVGAVGALSGSLIFFKFGDRVKIKKMIQISIVLGVVVTLLDFIYFTPALIHNPILARYIAVASTGIFSIIGAFSMLTILNFSAQMCPRYSEGTIFATLMSFWNIGGTGSQALGGFLFDVIGLKPLIVVSAVFTAAAWFLIPLLKLKK